MAKIIMIKRKKTNRKKNGKKIMIKKSKYPPLSRYPVPASKVAKLKYQSDVRSLNPAAGTLAIHVFSATGCYDPDITAAGHQPMGFDQWMTFYEHFCVIGSKITVTFWSAGSTPGVNQLICGIYTDSDTNSTTGLTAMLEQPGTRYTRLGYLSKDHVTISKVFSTKKFYHYKDIADNDNLKGSGSANPAEQAYFHVFAGAQDNFSDPGTMYINVQIDFIVRFSERKTLSQS